MNKDITIPELEWLEEIRPLFESKEQKRKLAEIIKENGLIRSRKHDNHKSSVSLKIKSFLECPQVVRDWLLTKALVESELNNNKS